MTIPATDKTNNDYLAYLDLRENNISNVQIAERLGYSKEDFGYLISQYEFQTNLEYHIPECEGDYYFNGSLFLSQGIMDTLSNKEIAEIFLFIKKLVKQHDGIDYLQTFYCIEHDCEVFVIDQLSKSMIETGKYKAEDNYFTFILAKEY